MDQLAFPTKPFPFRATIAQAGVLGLLAAGLGVFTIGALLSENAPLLLVAALFPFAAIILGRVRELLLAIIIFDIPLGLDIHLGFRDDVAKLGALGGFNISATSACLGLLYLLWLVEFVCNRGLRPPPRIRASLPLILYIAALGLSLLVATDLFLAASQIWLYAQMLLLYTYIASTTQTRQQVIFIVTMLLGGFLFESVLMNYVQLTGQNISLGPVSTFVDASYAGARLGGTLGSPNNAGGYLSTLMLLASSLLLTRLGMNHKLFAALAFASGGLALILTGSRGGWGSFAIALIVLLFVAGLRGWLSLQSSLALVLLTALLSILAHDAILTRVLADDSGAAHSRVALINLAIRIIADKPLLGIGANNFAAVMDEYMMPEFRGEWIYTVHNNFLLVWSETGTVGLAAFLLFLAATLRSAWACTRSRDLLIGPLGMGLTAAVLAHTLHMTVDLFNSRQPVQLLILLAGLIKAIHLWQPKRLERVR